MPGLVSLVVNLVSILRLSASISRAEADIIFADSIYNERLSQCSTLAESRFSRASSSAADTASLALIGTLENPVERSDLDQTCLLPGSSIHGIEEGNDLNKPVPLRKDAHFATSGESDRPIMTCDGFKRHEMEQIRYWVFMPDGPIENSPQGSRCALCPTLEPDVDHLKYHGTQEYANRTRQIRKSRRDEFEKVLRAHKASNEWIEKLIHDWRIDQKRKAYSCGFCVKLFKTLPERNKHLCHAHFHRGQNMDDWHVTNLIRGLLLQEEVNRAYREMFGMDPSNVDLRRTWRSSSLKDLQDRLELGKESPQELASAVHKAIGTLPSDCKILEAGSQFLPKSRSFPTPLVAPTQNSMSPLSASAPTAKKLPPSTKTLQEASDTHHQQVKRYDENSNLSSLRPAQIDLDSNVNMPLRSDSLGFGFNAQSNVAACMTGNSENFQPIYAGSIHPNLQEKWNPTNYIFNEEAGAQVTPCCNFGSFPLLPREACYDQLAFIDSYAQNDPQQHENTFEEASAQSHVSKRKLSEESVAVANSKAQTMSPMNFEYSAGNLKR